MLKIRLLAACLAPVVALIVWSTHSGSIAASQSVPRSEKDAAAKALDPGPRPKVGRNFPEILERVAFRAAKDGNYKAAIIFYRRILEHEPRRRSARLGLADALTRTGRHAEAIRIYRDVLAEAPGDPSSRSRLGGALLAGGRPNDALPHLMAALEARRTITTLNRIGVAHLLGGRTGTAQQYFNQALEIRPRDRVLRNNAAIALYRSGRREEAQRLLAEDVRDRKAPDELRKNLMLMKMAAMPGVSSARAFALLSAEDNGSPFVISSIGGSTGRPASAEPGEMASATTAPPRSARTSTNPPRKPSSAPSSRGDDASRPTTLARQNGSPPSGDPYRRLVIAGIASNLGKLAANGAIPAPNKSEDGSIRVAAVPERASPAGGSGGSNEAFLVQLGAFRDAVNARTARRRLLRAMGPLFEGIGIGVEPDDVAGRSRMYKLRTQKASGREAAEALCARLRARSVNCFIAKAPPG